MQFVGLAERNLKVEFGSSNWQEVQRNHLADSRISQTLGDICIPTYVVP
jgi:hypothetical protein